MTTRGTNQEPGAMRGVSQIQVVTSSVPPVHTKASATRRPAREAGSTYEQPLNPVEMRNAWSARSHPYVRMCMNEITKRLFSGDGIVALRNDEPQRPSPAFRTYLKRDMTPFAVDALHALLAFGVVPIAFRRPRTAGLGEHELAPYVPRFGTYTITTWADAGLQRFGFYWASAAFANQGWHAPMSLGSGPYGVYDPSVLVAHDFGYDPDVIGGHLTSNLYTISQHLRMAGELGNLALTAERIASNPPLITGYDSRVEDRAEKDFGESFFAGNPERCQERYDATYERSEARRQDLVHELERWEALTGMRARDEFSGPEGSVANAMSSSWRRAAGMVEPPEGARDYSGATMPWARQYRIGVTEQLVAHQLPRPRGDYVAVQSQIMDIVCGVLNVPRGLLASESSIRSGVEAVAEAMHRTINSYASLLSSLLTGVYNHIFGTADLRDELRIRMERRRRSPLDSAPQLLTEADLFEAVEKTRVRIAFDLPPTSTSESLQYLHDRGIITWKTFGTSMLRLNGFGREQLASHTDPVSKEDRRTLLLGKRADTGGGGGGDEGQKSARKAKNDAKKQADKTEDKERTNAKKQKTK